MSTPSVETVRGWLGRVMVDRDGNRLGEITDIYLDRETERPEWAVVRTGLFGTRSTFVPLTEAAEAGDQIQVPHERTTVKAAPNIEAEGHLSEAEEAELYRHYGLDYDAVTTDDRDTAAASPTADQPESQVNSAPPPTNVTPSAEPAGPAEFPVGEGVSRPFVYETPGPAEERPYGRRREPGQVRLRRYLVTEVVTETETGQRHEVRVEAEPVNHQDVPNLAATSNPEDAPARREQPEPDPNDWFRAEDDPRRRD